MDQIYLRSILPPKILSIINSFLYWSKDQQFIAKMRNLSTFHKFNIEYCKRLARDSEGITITQTGFNFATFLEGILIFPKLYKGLGPYLQKICINLLKNNPNLLFNGYHTGMGQTPAISLIVRYISCQNIYAYQIRPSEQLTIALYNVLKFFLENKLLELNVVIGYLLAQGLDLCVFTSCRTVELVQLVLQYLWSYLIQFHPSEITLQQELNKCKLFRNMGNILFGDIRKYMYYQKQGVHNIEIFLEEEYPILQKTFTRIFDMIDKKYPEIAALIHKISIHKITVANNSKFFYFISKFDNLRGIFFDNETLFKFFQNRQMKIASILWSDEKFRLRLSEVRLDGKNLLQTAADSYGLSHNLIIMLWNSGLFYQMPFIRNSKSRKIICQKYRMHQYS